MRLEPFTMPDLVGGNFRRPVHTLAHRDLKYLSAGEVSLHAGLVISKQDVESAACNVERTPESRSADDLADFGRLLSKLRRTEEKGRLQLADLAPDEKNLGRIRMSP